MGLSIFAYSKRFDLFAKRGSVMKPSNSRGNTSGGKSLSVTSAMPKLSKSGGLYVNKRGGSSSG